MSQLPYMDKFVLASKQTNPSFSINSPPSRPRLPSTTHMQLFSSLLAVAASVFVMVSAEEQAGSPKNRASNLNQKSRGHRSSRSSHPSIIGGDSSVWGPSSGCDLSSYSYTSPCSSAWSSSYRPCGLAGTTALCNPMSPAVAPLSPITDCDPLYGPGYGAYPGPPCGPCGPYNGNGCTPFVGGPCVNPVVNPCANPCVNPCYNPCDRRSRNSRGSRHLAHHEGRVQPWYVYLTATYTSTYTSTEIVQTDTTTTLTTVSYTLYTLSATPSAFQ